MSHELQPALPWYRRALDVLGRRARKAYAAGVSTATAVIATISFAGFFSDGKIDGGKVWTAAGAVVTGFLGGFLPVFFAPANEPSGKEQTLQPAKYPVADVQFDPSVDEPGIEDTPPR